MNGFQWTLRYELLFYDLLGFFLYTAQDKKSADAFIIPALSCRLFCMQNIFYRIAYQVACVSSCSTAATLGCAILPQALSFLCLRRCSADKKTPLLLISTVLFPSLPAFVA